MRPGSRLAYHSLNHGLFADEGGRSRRTSMYENVRAHIYELPKPAAVAPFPVPPFRHACWYPMHFQPPGLVRGRLTSHPTADCDCDCGCGYGYGYGKNFTCQGLKATPELWGIVTSPQTVAMGYGILRIVCPHSDERCSYSPAGNGYECRVEAVGAWALVHPNVRQSLQAYKYASKTLAAATISTLGRLHRRARDDVLPRGPHDDWPSPSTSQSAVCFCLYYPVVSVPTSLVLPHAGGLLAEPRRNSSNGLDRGVTASVTD